MWSTAQDWVRWFLNQNSVNLEHRKVIKYIKLKIEEAETQEVQGEVPTQMPVNPKSKAAPKSLATTVRSRPIPHPDAAGESPWVEQEMGRTEMTQIQSRMANLENALHQILIHLTPDMPVDSDLPEIPLASEWEDPWAA